VSPDERGLAHAAVPDEDHLELRNLHGRHPFVVGGRRSGRGDNREEADVARNHL